MAENYSRSFQSIQILLLLPQAIKAFLFLSLNQLLVLYSFKSKHTEDFGSVFGREESPDDTVGCENPKRMSGHRGACKASFGNPLVGCHAGN